MSLAREYLDQLVKEEELTLLGVVPVELGEDFDRFRLWLDEKRQAGMTYLERHLAVRQDPKLLLPRARSAIVLALPYGTDEDRVRRPKVAQYARFNDYHKLLRKKGERIASRFLEKFDRLQRVHQFRVVVDTAPLLEKALAGKTRLGFIGKNSCYIHPELGSFLLLSEILTTFPLELDRRDATPNGEKGKSCGSCTRCQAACPTGALDEAYRVDSNKCIAYWTIEHRGTIPEKFWPWLGEYYFGCDICQLVCPFNREMKSWLPASISPRSYPSLFEVATMDEAKYQHYFGGTALTRAKRHGLRRNALIAMTVTADSRLPEAIEMAKRDAPSPIAETLAQIERYRSSLLRNA